MFCSGCERWEARGKPWETQEALGCSRVLWGALGSSGELRRCLGGYGELWEALGSSGRPWEALGALGGSGNLLDIYESKGLKKKITILPIECLLLIPLLGHLLKA